MTFVRDDDPQTLQVFRWMRCMWLSTFVHGNRIAEGQIDAVERFIALQIQTGGQPHDLVVVVIMGADLLEVVDLFMPGVAS